MLKHWRDVLGIPDPNDPGPELAPGEWIIAQGRALFQKAMFGGRGGPIILTNRRILWYEDARIHWPFDSWTLWPFKRISEEFVLSEIASADKGTVLDWIGGGTRLRLNLRNGRSKCVFAPEGINEWITAMNGAVAMYGSGPQ